MSRSLPDNLKYPLFVDLEYSADKIIRDMYHLNNIAKGLEITDGGFKDEIDMIKTAIASINGVRSNTQIMLRASKQYDAADSK